MLIINIALIFILIFSSTGIGAELHGITTECKERACMISKYEKGKWVTSIDPNLNEKQCQDPSVVGSFLPSRKWVCTTKGMVAPEKIVGCDKWQCTIQVNDGLGGGTTRDKNLYGLTPKVCKEKRGIHSCSVQKEVEVLTSNHMEKQFIYVDKKFELMTNELNRNIEDLTNQHNNEWNSLKEQLTNGIDSIPSKAVTNQAKEDMKSEVLAEIEELIKQMKEELRNDILIKLSDASNSK